MEENSSQNVSPNQPAVPSTPVPPELSSQAAPQAPAPGPSAGSSQEISLGDTRDKSAQAGQAEQAPQGTSGQTKGTVLVADDDITLRDMYQTRLETEGYQVLVAADGEETLSIIKEKKPNVVLLDIMMPKINGLDVLAQMKKDETMKNIPVIILTALIQDLTKVKSLMSGADDYLMKSEVMPGEVIKKVEGVLEKSKGQ